ncbi:MAG: porin family protein [Pseudomonadota bacterium]|nr:porin family protein [Pseudomonadota bacterium]
MRTNNLLKAIVAAGALGLALPAFAENNSNVYIGGQAGIAHTDYDLGQFLDKHFSDDGFAGRLYLGYQLNEYLGVETGFAMFADADLPLNFGDIKTTHLDLLLKVGTPFGRSGFRGDLKGGAAHVMSKFDAGNLAESLGVGDESNWEIRAVAGASISYNLNRNIAVDVSYLHVFGDPQNHAFSTPNSDIAMLGVSFLFNV